MKSGNLAKTLRVHILVVEDDVIIGSSLTSYLHERGYATLWSTTVDKSIEILKTTSFSFAIVDINLSGDNSFPVIDRLLDMHVPILICSGYDEDSFDIKYRSIARTQKPLTRSKLDMFLSKMIN